MKDTLQCCVADPTDPVIEQLRANQLEVRSKIVLWKRPITTVHYFVRELLFEAKKLTVG